jgi:Ca2+/Na+ antiporter
MTGLVIELVVMLFVILAASELFTNALEHFGERLKISEGVTGSLFAAVGTALPETTVPLLACAVRRRRFPVGAIPTRRNAPAGSNRSSHGGNEVAEAFG